MAVVASGCGGVVKTVTNPAMVAGSDVVELVDVDAGMIAQHHPTVTIGRAECPTLLNLSGGSTADCTITVAGKPMRIGIRKTSAYAFGLTDVEAPVLRREIERQIAASYHTSSVRCGEPAVQIAPVPVEFTCSAGTYGRPIHVIIVGRAGEAGVGRGPPTPGWPSARRMLGEEITRQDRVTIAGPALERYVRSLANGLTRGELARRHLLGAAHCPARVTLTPGKHASCKVKLGDTSVGFDLRFDAGRGFIADANGTIIVVDTIAEAVRRAYVHARTVEGKPTAVTVRCAGGPVFITQPGELLPCDVKSAGDQRVIVVQIDDESGGFSVRGVEPISIDQR